MTVFLGRSRLTNVFGRSQEIDESLLTYVKLSDGSRMQFNFFESLDELPEFLASQIPIDDIVEVRTGNAIASADSMNLDFSRFSSLTSFAFPDDVQIQLQGTVTLPAAYEVIVPSCIDVQQEAVLNVGPQAAVYIEGLTYEQYSQDREAGKWNGLDANLKFAPVADTQFWYSDGTFASYPVVGTLFYDDVADGFSTGKTISRLTIGSDVTEVDEDFGYSIARSQTSALTSFSLSPNMVSSGSGFLLTALKSLDIPDGVREIEYGFLRTRSGVQSQLSFVNVPDSVSSIGWQAFMYSKQLKSAVLGDGLKTLSEEAFEFCTSLEDVVFKGNQLESVGPSCFLGTRLHDVKLPDSVTAIGDYAYDIRETLTGVTLPSSLAIVGNHAFFSAQIGKLSVPDSCLSIGDSAFESCHNLSTLIFGKGLKSIGVAAFSETYRLDGQDIVVPSELEKLGEACFAECHANSFDLSKTKLTAIERSTFRQASMANISLPQTLLKIGNLAFEDCKNLSTLTIPSSVDDIAEDAFQGSTSTTLSVCFEERSREQIQQLAGYPWRLNESWMTFG